MKAQVAQLNPNSKASKLSDEAYREAGPTESKPDYTYIDSNPVN